MATKKTTSAKTAAASQNNTLSVKDDPSVGRDAKLASLAMGCITGNAVTARSFANGIFGALSITECCATLRADVERICGGDLKQVEGALIAQSVSLNAIYNEMARRAALNMGEHLDATDRYMKLALRAQGQCRATLETLAEIKNPRPVSFVRQANIANGPQQINNGNAPGDGFNRQSHAHTAKVDSPQNKLLETADGNYLDTRAQSAASRVNSRLETVG